MKPSIVKKDQKKVSHLINDYHLLAYDEVDSTNLEARRLAEGGASNGAVIWAKQQTDGRGRMDREWLSCGHNLYVSVLLSPKCALDVAGQLSFVTAVSAIEAVAPLLPHGGDFGCKWPNDIMLNGKKLGGILLESFRTGEKKEHFWVVVGLGINIDAYPPNLEPAATSLGEAGVEIVSAKIVLSRFITHFILRYDEWATKGFAPIRKAWLENAYGLGKKMKVSLPDESFSGTFEGIDTKGQLMLMTDKGKTRKVPAGDVFFAV